VNTAAHGQRRVTLQTIADALSVSRTTVSNAYSRPDQLNPRLRQRILEVARQLGYAGPHPAARSLRSGRADAVGVLLTEMLSYAFTDPAAVRFLEGMAQAGEQAGVGLLLVPPLPASSEAAAVREAVVDGFVVYSMPDAHPAVLAVLERRQPTVVVDQPRIQGVPFVGIDDRLAARQAAEHLLALGHERFGVVCFRLSLDDYSGPVNAARLAGATFRLTRDRLAGYADALRAAGLNFRKVPIEERPLNSAAAGADAAAALLDRRHPPTAILSTSDQLAIGLLEETRRRGIAVPGELSVVGFDDIEPTATATPPLTTVRQSLLEKGRVAGRLILEQEAPPRGDTLLLPTELVVRASTAPARAARRSLGVPGPGRPAAIARGAVLPGR
jgi:DNA-binding LacI/PurR family transcriptional regulator